MKNKNYRISEQLWDNEEYCNRYANTWEISKDEVHYGWLAPGENTLKLMEDIDLKDARILDVGCGMGENMIALVKRGAQSFGVDISPYMLSYARKNFTEFADEDKIFFTQENMRDFCSFSDISFDLIISVYSIEYLDSIKTLKEVLSNLFSRLKPNGVFIFCFSHPLQHYRHHELQNNSAPSAVSTKSNLIYSFRDVVGALSDIGFTIERIVEQITQNPSQILYEETQEFPYRFSKDNNPCLPKFDKLSNKAPHTIIYKVRRPSKITPPQLKFDFGASKLRIWEQNRTVVERKDFKIGEKQYIIKKLSPKDSIIGLCEILAFQVAKTDLELREQQKLDISCYKENKKFDIRENCLLNIIRKRLISENLIPILEYSDFIISDYNAKGVFIKQIEPVFKKISEQFPNQKLGVLIFVNENEPAQGTIGLQDIIPSIGDKVQIICVITGKRLRGKSNFIKQGPRLFDC